MPRTKLLLVLAAAAALLGASAPPDPNDLLRQSIEAPRHLSYAGQMETVLFGTSKAEATIYRIEHRAPDLTRRWYVAPQSLYGDWSISRGAQSYNVDVKTHRVIVSKNGLIDDQVAVNDNFALLANNYRTLLGPKETIAGRSAQVLVLLNKYTGAVTMRLWLDTQTHLVLERESYARNGSVTHQIRFDQIRYTNDLPGVIFSEPKLAGFQLTKGLDHEAPSNDFETVLRTAGFHARGPKYLPHGFYPIGADVSDIKNTRTLHVLYSDGLRTLSLFENARGAAVDLTHYKIRDAKVADHDAQYVEDGPTRLLTWTEESGLHYALVGELSQKELVRIAASVEP